MRNPSKQHVDILGKQLVVAGAFTGLKANGPPAVGIAVQRNSGAIHRGGVLIRQIPIKPEFRQVEGEVALQAVISDGIFRILQSVDVHINGQFVPQTISF